MILQFVAFPDQRLDNNVVFVHSENLLIPFFAAPLDIDIQSLDLLIQRG
jgi:hypothetical protein